MMTEISIGEPVPGPGKIPGSAYKKNLVQVSSRQGGAPATG